MGGLLSYLFSWGTPSYDHTPDPGTGLSEYDRHLISETWALMSDKKSIKQNGMEFFLLLFKTFPKSQDLFHDFKNKSPSELRNMSKMKAHVLSVMYSLGSLVENMEDASTLVGLVNKLAVSHISRGVTYHDFENVREVFIAFIRIGLGKQCTPEVEQAWTKLLDAQTALVKQAQVDAGKK